MAVTGILETNAYYEQYKVEQPWVAKSGSAELDQPGFIKRTSSRIDDGKISIPKNAPSSGKEFLTYLKNRFGIQKLKCHFNEENIYSVINNYQNGGGPILVYVHSSSWDHEDKIVKNVLNNEEFANVIVVLRSI
jgi:hypothetical protein